MSSLPPDPYKALGVKKDAQLPEIRAAHRKLVLKCHPDKVQDPALKAEKQDEFQRVQQAYELLSDEKERTKYDEQVKLMELRREFQKEFQKTSANTSSPRTPPRHFEVRTAEPRPSTFASGPMPVPPKMYSQKYPTRSFEDEIHTSSRAFFDELNGGRSARRTASYDEKPSRRDDEREREKEKERERRRRKEEEEERRDQERRAAEKEARRAEKKKAEKAREKERRREGDSKRSRHSPYVEEYVDEDGGFAIPREQREPRIEKKKSSSSTKKHDEKYEVVPDATAAKYNDSLQQAASYLANSRAKVGASTKLSRPDAFSYIRLSPPAVPTPPPAPQGPFQAPVEEEEEDDEVHRSSARASGRRTSDTPRSSKEKSSHKKSGSGPMEAPESPLIFEASPSMRHAPQFSKSTSAQPFMPEPRPGDVPRASTMHPGDFPRAMPMPSMRRAETYHPGMDIPAADPRGRSRSRFAPQVEIEEFSEDEIDDRRREHRSKHRSSRHKTRSPSPPPVQYSRPIPQHTRYNVSNDGRAVPVEAFFDESPRSTSSRKHSSKTYYGSPKTGYAPRIVEVRPSGPSRGDTWSAGSPSFSKLRTAKHYDEGDINYSNLPRSAHREEYAAAW